MDFKKFTQILICKVQLYIGNEYEVFEHEVTKNNGVCLTGITARKEGMNTFPTIYVNDFYTPGIKEDEIEYLAVKLSHKLKSASPSEDVDIESFTDFKEASKNLAFKIINAEKNKELLMKVPHRRLLNLAVVYIYILENEKLGGKGTILIRNEHMDEWEVDEEELYNHAVKNMYLLLPVRIERIKDVINEMYGGEVIEEDIDMYVVSNEDKFYGSGYMFVKDVLRGVFDKIGRNYYVLPSSVHEFIALPESPETDARDLLKTVTEINETQVREEERLSDSVYYYDHSKDELVWIC